MPRFLPLVLVALVAASCGASDRRPVPGVALIPSIGATRAPSSAALLATAPSTTTTAPASPRTDPPRASRNAPAGRTTPPSTRPPAPAAPRPGPGERRPLGTFRVTCYGPPHFPQGQRTASGRPVGPSSVSVDPRVIPLGTWLELEGLGRRRADDTGRLVKGHHLDLWRSSCAGWANPSVAVYVVDGP